MPFRLPLLAILLISLTSLTTQTGSLNAVAGKLTTLSSVSRMHAFMAKYSGDANNRGRTSALLN